MLVQIQSIPLPNISTPFYMLSSVPSMPFDMLTLNLSPSSLARSKSHSLLKGSNEQLDIVMNE